MRTAEGIIELLVAANVGALAPNSLTPWPIYEGQLPETVDQCILVRETGGPRPEVRVAIDYPSIQVLIRGDKEGYVATSEKADKVKLALHAIPTPVQEFPELASCVLTAEKTFVGYDSNKRPVWSVNFNLILGKDPEGYRDL
jgi:hypothetical protein